LLDTKLEQSLAALLEPNQTLTKLSITMKDVTSRNNLERVLMRNAELVRTRRAAAKKARGGASSSSAPKVGGVSTPCHVCKEPVYAAERLVVDQASEQLVLHRRCFRCKFCKQIVKFGNFSAVDGVFYCLPHFKQLFQEQGGSYANMGDGQKAAADVKPTPSAIAAKFTKAHDKCAVCDTIVYPTDQVILEKGSGDKALLHKACLKCSNCSTKLTQATYMLVTIDGAEKYFCKRHGKEATEAALVARQAQFEGATNMYAAFGKEYGQEAAAKKAAADGESTDDAGDVRVDDAVRGAMSKLRTTEAAAAAPAASSNAAAEVSEAEKAIAASAKRREKAAEANSEVAAIEEDRERRRREREERQKEIEATAAREEKEAAARREERRRAREQAESAADAEAQKQREEREAARLERQRVTDASRSADIEAEERAAERERERAKRRAALEAESAAKDRELEERRAARQKEREEREAREKAEEAERQRKREERRAALNN
jgi:DNA repair exonuclease SbcCD ATPase subunit